MLQTFHPSISQWFADEYHEPTEVQLAAWPVIAQGKHTLITAPTGSGKTLTAFLWAMSQFASKDEQAEPARPQTRVLYISPLKALNNDIQHNLLGPLQSLNENYNYPRVRVQTRSGDTSQGDRQRMLRHPPDILITTPESLALMLTTAKGRLALSGIETLILDEIHSIVDNRRGVQLMANVERLVDIAGEFQRIALSATVSPLEAVAAYIAGKDARGRPRVVDIVNTPGNKKINFRVRFPEQVRIALENGDKIWEPLSDSFRDVISANDATLFFTNSRAMAEKITLKINREQVAPVAYAHHGSLAREVRTEVEKRLKNGHLQAIVATSSLEMGIDIGHLDEVVMVQSPPSVAATLQRVGRAGHRVGETSIGTVYPTHAQDFLEAAVLAEAVGERDIEPQKLMYGALDVLAQIVISICATDPWPIDDLFNLITRASPYHNLSREQFDLVIEMLAGRYEGSRIRELKARVTHDRINRTIQATRGAVLALYNSGGTIPDRGYFQMRHADTGTILGDLDEEFVWEATVGDNFTLGTQAWQVQRITHNDVIVRPAKVGSTAPPFWRNEFFNRSFHFSKRITQYLEMAEGQLSADQGEGLVDALIRQAGFEPGAATELIDYLKRQRLHTQAALPHRHHLLLERVKSGPAGYRGPDDPQQLVIHTGWGGRLNHPWALALAAAWQIETRNKLDVHADNNAIVLQIKAEVEPTFLLNLVTTENLLTLLRASLEQSGYFGARFRECAGRSLLLAKHKFNQRQPLWMSRMQAKKLMTQVKKLSDFPVLLETWRTCLEDEFDLPALNSRLAEIADGTLTWSYVSTSTPSPFAQNITFGQVSRYMYADDTPEDDALSHLSEDVIALALKDSSLRPEIEPQVIEIFEEKRQRRAPGYQPESALDWSEWLKERLLLPAGEVLAVSSELPDSAIWLTLPDGRRWVTHLELVHPLRRAGLIPEQTTFNPAMTPWPDVEDRRDVQQLFREIFSFYGPKTESQLADLLPHLPEDILHEDETLLRGGFVAGSRHLFWCDAENFEILMRFQRASRRANFTALAATQLPLFWAGLHRLHGADDEQNRLYAAEMLRGYGTHVSAWLSDLPAARLNGFEPRTWQAGLQQQGITWRGVGREMTTFAYPEELELFGQGNLNPPEFSSAFADPSARYSFTQVADNTGTSNANLNETWWQAVWNGQIASDGVEALEFGATQNFTLNHTQRPVSSRRRLFRTPVGWPGYWHLCRDADIPDPLSQLEADKERVRLLLDRYGMINRDIVNRENLPAGLAQEGRWRWRQAFRALRIMELGGEVITGHFFSGLSTPQFISPRALSALTGNTAHLRDFWISALDPVSPCGLGLDWSALPQRRGGNYMAFQDGELALVVQSNGKELTYFLPWHDQNLAQVNAPLVHLVEHCRKHVGISIINGQAARNSPYLEPLNRQFSVVQDHKNVTLQPTF